MTTTLARQAAKETLQDPDVSSRAALAAVNTLIQFWEQEAKAGRGATYARPQWDATIVKLQAAAQRFSELYTQQPLA